MQIAPVSPEVASMIITSYARPHREHAAQMKPSSSAFIAFFFWQECAVWVKLYIWLMSKCKEGSATSGNKGQALKKKKDVTKTMKTYT